MSISTIHEEFLTAVEALETCLMTPRVPGELERWTDDAETAIEGVGTILVRQIDQEHRTHFQQITTQDPELHARVERLKVGDVQCQEQHRTLQNRIRSLKKSVPQIEPDEAKLEPALVDFCADGLAFVLNLRKQEIAIETWLQEAFNRDRGTGG